MLELSLLDLPDAEGRSHPVERNDPRQLPSNSRNDITVLGLLE